MKKDEIIEFNTEIRIAEKRIEEWKKKLADMKKEYYEDYFSTDWGEYALLTDLPDEDMILSSDEIHKLYEYSILNVDEIGKIICEMCALREGCEYHSARAKYYPDVMTSFQYYLDGNVYQKYLKHCEPILAIGEDIKKVYYGDDLNLRDIIYIEFCSGEHFSNLPMDNPVIRSNFGRSMQYSNYRPLLEKNGSLAISNYVLYDFIKPLIYSLAYYQRQHNITTMSADQTRDVYKRIYKIEN